MDTVSVRLSPDLAKGLAGVAENRGLSKSELIRRALREYLRRNQEPAQKRGSVIDVAGDLVGCLEGPPDLSRNKKYRQGFGQ